ncbi:MAG: type II toxin-antitoxin system RelE/ParE family toxin [Bacteroidales bacterium]
MGHTKEKAPEAYSLRVSDNALRNIDDITGYITYINHQPLTAIKVGDKLFQTIDRIQKNPLAFRECWEIPTKSKMYRQAICLRWLIIYKVKSSRIVILGIIHSSRKPSRIRSLRKIQ